MGIYSRIKGWLGAEDIAQMAAEQRNLRAVYDDVLLGLAEAANLAPVKDGDSALLFAQGGVPRTWSIDGIVEPGQFRRVSLALIQTARDKLAESVGSAMILGLNETDALLDWADIFAHAAALEWFEGGFYMWIREDEARARFGRRALLVTLFAPHMLHRARGRDGTGYDRNREAIEGYTGDYYFGAADAGTLIPNGELVRYITARNPLQADARLLNAIRLGYALLDGETTSVGARGKPYGVVTINTEQRRPANDDAYVAAREGKATSAQDELSGARIVMERAWSIAKELLVLYAGETFQPVPKSGNPTMAISLDQVRNLIAVDAGMSPSTLGVPIAMSYNNLRTTDALFLENRVEPLGRDIAAAIRHWRGGALGSRERLSQMSVSYASHSATLIRGEQAAEAKRIQARAVQTLVQAGMGLDAALALIGLTPDETPQALVAADDRTLAQVLDDALLTMSPASKAQAALVAANAARQDASEEGALVDENALRVAMGLEPKH